MTEGIIEVLTKLYSMKPQFGRHAPSAPEQALARSAEKLLAIALGLFWLLLVLIPFHKTHPLPTDLRWIVQGLAVVVVILPLIAEVLMVMETILAIFTISRAKPERFIEEVKMFNNQVAALSTFAISDLQNARRHLERVTKQLGARVAFVAGASDKISLLSLAATAWATYEALKKAVDLPAFSELTVKDAPNLLIISVAVGLGMLLTNALFISRRSRLHEFHITLVDEQLARLSSVVRPSAD